MDKNGSPTCAEPKINEMKHSLPEAQNGSGPSAPVLRSVKKLCGKKITGLDGEIGHVRDLYFDDLKWTIRYVVAGTGSWLPERQVLIAPHAFGTFSQQQDHLLVNLRQKQVQNCPAIDSQKPVSREYEEEYYRYYGWPPYWDGDAMWGLSRLPIAAPPDLKQVDPSRLVPVERDEPHLRSAKALNGYLMLTEQGEGGRLVDFIMDDRSWEIRILIVDTGRVLLKERELRQHERARPERNGTRHDTTAPASPKKPTLLPPNSTTSNRTHPDDWFSGKEIAISPAQIDRISYDESRIFVNVTIDAIREAHEFQLLTAASPDRDESEF